MHRLLQCRRWETFQTQMYWAAFYWGTYLENNWEHNCSCKQKYFFFFFNLSFRTLLWRGFMFSLICLTCKWSCNGLVSKTWENQSQWKIRSNNSHPLSLLVVKEYNQRSLHCFCKLSHCQKCFSWWGYLGCVCVCVFHNCIHNCFPAAATDVSLWAEKCGL